MGWSLPGHWQAINDRNFRRRASIEQAWFPLGAQEPAARCWRRRRWWQRLPPDRYSGPRAKRWARGNPVGGSMRAVEAVAGPAGPKTRTTRMSPAVRRCPCPGSRVQCPVAAVPGQRALTKDPAHRVRGIAFGIWLTGCFESASISQLGRYRLRVLRSISPSGRRRHAEHRGVLAPWRSPLGAATKASLICRPILRRHTMRSPPCACSGGTSIASASRFNRRKLRTLNGNMPT